MLLAGAAGNVLAALGHEAAHVAVGASTATFGALGPPGPVVQWVLAALVVVACWALALAPPP